MPQRLRDADLDLRLTKGAYKKQSKALAQRLLAAQLACFAARIPTVLVFEGWDAAGKGGTIRRLLEQIDPRFYRVHGVAKPTPEELAHHYLWRFWTRLPPRGEIATFDRSWYGRVMVERVESFARPDEWRRAYAEINQFEKLLTDDGHLVVKCFLHISKKEQAQRFKAREENPLKSWKMGPEDYRNRRKWDRYEAAIDDLLARTDSKAAPWHIIPANDKHFARIAVQEIVCTAWEGALRKAGRRKATG